jgi:methyltransferase (TIGR00027 family)
MEETRPSVTAAIVAAFRSLGEMLPADAHVARDPYGAKFLGEWAEHALVVAKTAPVLAKPLERYVLYMQIRTRAIDDVLLSFAREGGTQVVLLGAGFDARAWRFGPQLAGVTFFEVDHPATQLKKRAQSPGELQGAKVEYLSFNFEKQSMDELPAALAAIGCSPDRRTLTIWEGVTMYLTEPALDASLAAVQKYSAPGSLLAFTYFERKRLIEKPHWRQRMVRRFVGSVGEPFTWGWDAGEAEPWFLARGFVMVTDRTEKDLADALLPAKFAARVRSEGRHVAVAVRK